MTDSVFNDYLAKISSKVFPTFYHVCVVVVVEVDVVVKWSVKQDSYVHFTYLPR